ncbi:MAG: peptide chain release factor N(5)-glutamine methyltransferase [Caldimicrobium sp.]|nr:peptide chain release factor N(5)-glutamine methyltransferase [Caldimicrobium sp.]MDW8182207.1 peptide chain release factor N(5)-glutamine methyltransferase [Caldimicrobium sp.]
MKVKRALSYLRHRLSDIEEEDYAQKEALEILAHLLGVSPLNVYLHAEEEISEEELQRILLERLKGKPLPYILKKAYFYGRPFFIEEGVLIPRPETELLVEVFLSLGIDEGLLLELGCGSGAVAVTLLLERPKINVLALDISPKALKITQINARHFQVENRLFLVRANWLTSLKEGPFFRAIISNPPYLSTNEWTELTPEVKNFEPMTALVAGPKGTEYQEILIQEGLKYLASHGIIIFEMGYNQASRIKDIVRGWSYRFYRDLLGFERVILLWIEGENT